MNNEAVEQKLGGRRFAVSMWNGFEVAFQRVTTGRHDLKTLMAYVEERAAAEEHYARALAKLAKAHEFETESSLSAVWQNLRSSTAAEAKEHQQLAATLRQELGANIDKKIKEIKAGKQVMQREHSSLNSDVAKRGKDHDKRKRSYYDAVKQAETSWLNREAGKKERLPEQQLKRLETHVKKHTKDVDSTHGKYKEAVDSLRSAQVLLDQKTTLHLETFEQMERNRSIFLAEQFERLLQLKEKLVESAQASKELVAAGLGQVDTEGDIVAFIEKHEAKGSPPDHVQYLPCSSEIIGHAVGAGPPPPAAAAASGPIAVPPPSSGGAAPPPPPAGGGGGGGGGNYAVALFDFESAQDGDLAFKTGDRILVLNGGPNKQWWDGKIEADGRTGTFPANYVEMQGGGDGGAAPPAPPAAEPAATPAAEPAAAAASDEVAPPGGAAAGGGGDAGAGGDAETTQIEGQCKALYDFAAQSDDELAFTAGEILTVTGEINGWFLGKSEDGTRVGIFPSNYVAML